MVYGLWFMLSAAEHLQKYFTGQRGGLTTSTPVFGTSLLEGLKSVVSAYQCWMRVSTTDLGVMLIQRGALRV